VAAEEVELLVRIEAAFTPVDALHGAESPWSEERRDAGRPRPLAHAVEPLFVLDFVAVHELLVAEDVTVRVHDAFGEPGCARRVVELRGVLG
jgi:hypothetical protein